jgi:hydrogenase expression/formation protein HypE
MQQDYQRIMLAHGGGGQLTADLIAQTILPALDNPLLRKLGDSAVLEVAGQRLAFTTDSYVVQPLEFPGGDIGRLAVCGTVNDLAMAGAEPIALSLALILEEGLEMATLERIVASIAAAGAEAGVHVVAGDTKVIERRAGPRIAQIAERGSERRVSTPANTAGAAPGGASVAPDSAGVVPGTTAAGMVPGAMAGGTTFGGGSQTSQMDGMYITTAGVGKVLPEAQLGYDRTASGDVVLINGPIAEHGLTVLSRRKDLKFGSALKSDAAPLAGLANLLVRELKGAVKLLRDPTRSGLAGVVAEIAAAGGKSVELYEDRIPLTADARAAAEVLGLDPLTIANEGKFVAVVAPEAAKGALTLLHRHPLGRQAAVVGRITQTEPPALAELVTAIGGRRVIQMPYGEQLPRIC